MKLINKPLTKEEKFFECDMLIGNRNRICVTDSKGELFSQLGFAIERLFVLAQSRYLELVEREREDNV